MDLPKDFCFDSIWAILALVTLICSSTSRSCLLSCTLNFKLSTTKLWPLYIVVACCMFAVQTT